MTYSVRRDEDSGDEAKDMIGEAGREEERGDAESSLHFLALLCSSARCPAPASSAPRTS